MNFNRYNLESTRAPRQRVPWLLYLGIAAAAGLVIWVGILLWPSGDDDGEPAANAPETTAEATATPSAAAITPSPSAPPAPKPKPAPVPVPVPAVATRPAAAPATPPAPTPPPAAAHTAPVAPPRTAAIPPRTSSVAAPASALGPALEAKTAGDYARARALALQAWNSPATPGQKLQAEELLNELGIALVLSSREMPEKTDYTVQSGDSLAKIAKKFGTTVELIMAGNNLHGSTIRAGDRLRILEGKFSVKVSKSRNDLELYLNDQFFKRYRVGTGQHNKTPVGDFLVNDRIAKPTWWRPDGKSIPFGDPENLLGTHWLSINVKGYGLHGTWEPDTIGKQASAGCVRMLNSDIEQLFTLLPLGTPVSIRD